MRFQWHCLRYFESWFTWWRRLAHQYFTLLGKIVWSNRASLSPRILDTWYWICRTQYALGTLVEHVEAWRALKLRTDQYMYMSTRRGVSSAICEVMARDRVEWGVEKHTGLWCHQKDYIQTFKCIEFSNYTPPMRMLNESCTYGSKTGRHEF